MFAIYYGFNTWVACFDSGELYAAGSKEEIDNIIVSWNTGI